MLFPFDILDLYPTFGVGLGIFKCMSGKRLKQYDTRSLIDFCLQCV